MFRRNILGLALSLALVSPAFAADSLTWLKPSDVDPDVLLPAPPADGTPVAKAEIAELHRIQKTRTRAEFALAQYDNDHEDGWYLTSLLGPKFNAAALPATAALLDDVRREAFAAGRPSKAKFHRLRPWSVDPTIVGCPHPGPAIVRTSYPSGHSTVGFAVAVVMANVLPKHGADIMDRASQYAEERLVCGHHFRSDVEAGETLGTVVGVLLVHDPRFQPEMDKARVELTAAGF